MNQVKLCARLFAVFAKIGACTFGGGYAMLPILQREVVENRGWATDEELTDYFAIGQCTPGAIAVNTATFIGGNLAGIPGAICATLGLLFPSLVIISVIAAFLQNFAHLAAVQHAFGGIRACVCVLIFNSVLKLRKSTVIDRPTAVIFFGALALALIAQFLNPAGILGVLVSPAVIVVLAGICGLGWKEAHKG